VNPQGKINPKRLRLLALGALGVVYGDIGTSPLYALKESFHSRHNEFLGEAGVLGILSLILWSLILIVSVKYIMLVLRADFKGEGGILALLALLTSDSKRPLGKNSATIFATLGVFGAALLYGDGVITPAISVLSAVEGLGYVVPSLSHLVMPLAILILFLLFVVQKIGTGHVGVIFGPVMSLWFLSIAAVGIWQLIHEPRVLLAFDPSWGFSYLTTNGPSGLLVLGSVFLAVTGAEALYADLGHFGRRPISLAWHSLALPALALNYLGQGALVLRDPTAIENPFFAAVPGWAFFPMLGLATAAAVIASQALISGAFSLTLQAVQLGYCPRLEIRHTSRDECGQIYIPQVNWTLMIGCIALVLGFRSSGALASAYGIAVTMTMVITTILFFSVTRRLWNWHPAISLAVGGTFLVIEFGFLGANLVKIPNGGWFALMAAAIIFILMRTWKKGRSALFERIKPSLLPLDLFLESLDHSTVTVVRGCAVFLTSNPDTTPLALLHNLKHNKVLHETVIILTIKTELRAYMEADDEQISIRHLGHGFHQVTAVYGYMDVPDVPRLLTRFGELGIPIEPQEVTYFLSRERLVKGSHGNLRNWEMGLFSIQSKHGTSPADFYHLPPDRVVEIGMQISF